MCFSPILWFSGAVLSEGYRGVFLLCDPLLPSPLYASGSSCMGVSPALTQDFQMPDSWGTGIQPLLCPPPPHSSPGREAPAWPGSCTASPCGVCVCWAPWRCRLALTELLGRAGGACLLGFFCGPSLVSLLPLWGHLPLLSLLSFLHPHHSGSGGSALQPHGDTTPFPWTLG